MTGKTIKLSFQNVKNGKKLRKGNSNELKLYL